MLWTNRAPAPEDELAQARADLAALEAEAMEGPRAIEAARGRLASLTKARAERRQAEKRERIGRAELDRINLEIEILEHARSIAEIADRAGPRARKLRPTTLSVIRLSREISSRDLIRQIAVRRRDLERELALLAETREEAITA